MNQFFTGIGSRDAPEETLNTLQELSSFFCDKGYILRSGGANGCDTACENGCIDADGRSEIYLPWEDFNDRIYCNLYLEALPFIKEAREIAEKHHPKWDELSVSVKKMHTRNVYQILGLTLDKPSNFVICYAPIKDGQPQGGTAQAIRIAQTYNVPVTIFTNIKTLNL